MNANWVWLALAAAVLILAAFYLFKNGLKAPLLFLRSTALITLILTLIGAFAKTVELIWGSTTTVAINTAPFWPVNPPTFEYKTDGTASVISGGFSSALVDISGLSLGTKLTFLLSTLASAVLVVILCLFVLQIVDALRAGNAFGDALVARASLTGWVVLAAGLVASGALQIANYLSQVEFFGRERNWDWGSNNGTIDNPWLTGQDFDMEKVFGVVKPHFQLSIDIWPILIAVALLVSAKILKSGREMRTELDGLV